MFIMERVLAKYWSSLSVFKENYSGFGVSVLNIGGSSFGEKSFIKALSKI